MKFDEWFPPGRYELQYERMLKKLFRDIYKRIAGKDFTDPQEFLTEVKDLFTSKFFRETGWTIASKMVTGLAVTNARNWREAASESMRGKEIYQALQREITGSSVGNKIDSLITENARLISTLPEDLTLQAADFIKNEAFKGRRPAAITADLMEQFPDVSDGRLKTIARTESSKAWTALTHARSEDLGLDWYIWRTSKNVRVRNSHKKMDGVVCNWNDPPSPEALDHEKRTYGHYAPGEIFNCRCIPQPIVNLNRIHFPARVYHGGEIEYMTKAAFQKMFLGMEHRVAA